jgi:hypothetical protein
LLMATILSITEKIDNVGRWGRPSALRWPDADRDHCAGTIQRV